MTQENRNVVRVFAFMGSIVAVLFLGGAVGDFLGGAYGLAFVGLGLMSISIFAYYLTTTDD